MTAHSTAPHQRQCQIARTPASMAAGRPTARPPANPPRPAAPNTARLSQLRIITWSIAAFSGLSGVILRHSTLFSAGLLSSVPRKFICGCWVYVNCNTTMAALAMRQATSQVTARQATLAASFELRSTRGSVTNVWTVTPKHSRVISAVGQAMMRRNSCSFSMSVGGQGLRLEQAGDGVRCLGCSRWSRDTAAVHRIKL